MLDHVALGLVAKGSMVLKASIDGVRGRSVAYSRSSVNVSKISRTTSIVAVYTPRASWGRERRGVLQPERRGARYARAPMVPRWSVKVDRERCDER